MRRRLVLGFPPHLVEQPITYRLIRDYGLVVNILRARISPGERGTLVVELEGPEEVMRRGLEYLRGLGVEVQGLARDVRWDEARCVHCGLCACLCPSGAFRMERPSFRVTFDQERCIACERCVEVCPYGAVELRF